MAGCLWRVRELLVAGEGSCLWRVKELPVAGEGTACGG